MVNAIAHLGGTLHVTRGDPDNAAACHHAKDLRQSVIVQNTGYRSPVSCSGMNKNKLAIVLDVKHHIGEAARGIRCRTQLRIEGIDPLSLGIADLDNPQQLQQT